MVLNIFFWFLSSLRISDIALISSADFLGNIKIILKDKLKSDHENTLRHLKRKETQ